ncbi:MAG: N-acetylmuramoyl-L-alanine amidase [Candidatus Gracilibacteria bacterium]
MYKQELQTNNKSKGVNTREFIIVHHTGTKHGTIKGVLNTLTKGKVSVHYVVDFNGDIYKIGSTKDILWHCGKSEWKGKTNMNKYSIGIEVIGGVGEEFPLAQRQAVRELIQHLMKIFDIPKENVLRHSDIAPGRKIDISDSFSNHGFKSWKKYQESL